VQVISCSGFDITYKATQSGLNRTLCIKEYFLADKCVRDMQTKNLLVQGTNEDIFEKYRQKFLEEATLLARVKHPNIIDVIDAFNENNSSYIVMPFIEGQTLQHLVEIKGVLDIPTVINYFVQLAATIDYIHKKYILHRDIKPDNIIITPDNRIILTDFSIAREFVHDKTQSQTVMLTHGYAPPEQYSKISRKDSYTDVYAIGATMYFTLTGQSPMDAATRTVENMPAPITINPKISPAINNVILKAMSLKTEDRYQYAEDFKAALIQAANQEPTEILPQQTAKNLTDIWNSLLHDKNLKVNLQNIMATNATQIYNEGDIYKGQTKDGVRHGLGAYLWKEGYFYFGEWDNGKMAGKGINIMLKGYVQTNCPNCQFFIGYFLDGEKFGIGYCYNENGIPIYDGNFMGDKPIENYPMKIADNFGKFSIYDISNDGSVYIGSTIKDEANGMGIYISREGYMFYGQWKNSKLNGEGISIPPDGEITAGIWKNNKFVSPFVNQVPTEKKQNEIVCKNKLSLKSIWVVRTILLFVFIVSFFLLTSFHTQLRWIEYPMYAAMLSLIWSTWKHRDKK
jgi:serine/threonine protein kinase